MSAYSIEPQVRIPMPDMPKRSNPVRDDCLVIFKVNGDMSPQCRDAITRDLLSQLAAGIVIVDGDVDVIIAHPETVKVEVLRK